MHKLKLSIEEKAAKKLIGTTPAASKKTIKTLGTAKNAAFAPRMKMKNKQTGKT